MSLHRCVRRVLRARLGHRSGPDRCRIITNCNITPQRLNGRDRERLEDSYEQKPAGRRVLLDDVPAGCAYAVIDPSNDPCGRTERTIEIRAPSGKLCGALKFPVDGGGYCCTICKSATTAPSSSSSPKARRRPSRTERAPARGAGGHTSSVRAECWNGESGPGKATDV